MSPLLLLQRQSARLPQDLAVVPLLVVTPLLGGSGAQLGVALRSAAIKSASALTLIFIVGRVLLQRVFQLVASAKDQTSFLAITLLTVLSMSAFTQVLRAATRSGVLWRAVACCEISQTATHGHTRLHSVTCGERLFPGRAVGLSGCRLHAVQTRCYGRQALGLSDTLGAFLAGILLAETKYRYQIEADIAPFRGLLLGLFFITTGFSIDVALALRSAPVVIGLAAALHVLKTAITAAIGIFVGGLNPAAAVRSGLLLSQARNRR